MKKVNFLGKDYKAPEWANYIATDGGKSEIWVFECLPRYIDHLFCWDRSTGEVGLIDHDDDNRAMSAMMCIGEDNEQTRNNRVAYL